jgi:glycosyltransferase involved in cell wall biosynthesis
MRVLAFPKSSDKNPYTDLLYKNVERLGVEVVEFDPRMGSKERGDVLHVHWPEWFLVRRNPLAVWRHYAMWMECLRSLRRQGTKVVWTAHNLRSHENRHELLQRKFWSEFVPLVDGCVCLSEVSRSLVREAFPGLKCPTAVVPHGHYRDVYPNTVHRSAARASLGLDPSDFVFVHVGMVREYKNVPELIAAFRDCERPCTLVVAGEVFEEGLKRRVEAAAEGCANVHLHLRRVDDSDLQLYFRAADVAVFPYRDILNSGSALMALSFDVPLLVPSLGSMPELRQQVGEAWVMTYEGEVTGQVLSQGREWARKTARAERAPLDGLDWLPLARRTVEFYREVCARPETPNVPVA